MHSCLILSCLLQMDWRTVHDESIPLGRFALHRFYLLHLSLHFLLHQILDFLLFLLKLHLPENYLNLETFFVLPIFEHLKVQDYFLFFHKQIGK